MCQIVNISFSYYDSNIKWTQEHEMQLNIATLSQNKRERREKKRMNVIKAAASVPDFWRFRRTLTRHSITNQMFFFSKNNKSERSDSGNEQH